MNSGRDYQNSVVDTFFENIDRNNILSNLVNIFTGGGKTVVASLIMEKYMRKTGKKCLFLVDQIELVDQAVDSFVEWNPNIRVGAEQADRTSRASDQIVVACTATIGKNISKRIKKFDPDEYGLIICDEAHKSVSEIWMRVLRYFQVHPEDFNDNKSLLGFTATTNRPDGIPLGKIYDDIIGSYDVRWGIKNGWLTDIELFQVQTGVDASNLERGSSGEFTKTSLDALLNVSNRNAQIVKSYKEYSDGETAVVYCTSVQHAYTIAEMFERIGVKAACIEATTDKRERKYAIEAFRDGDIKVLTNYATLTTGFDSKNTTTGIFARPVRSELLFLQMLGRFLRPSENSFIDVWSSVDKRKEAIANSTKPAAKIIDFCDVTNDNSIVTVPSLFGINPKMKVREGDRVLKEIVEPLEDLAETEHIDLRHVPDMDTVKLYVKRKNVELKQLEPDEQMKKLSKSIWYSLSETEYQTIYPKDNISIHLRQDLLGKWEVVVYNTKQNSFMRLNSFASLSGAVHLADRWAEDNKLQTFSNKHDAVWRSNGLSPQMSKLLLTLYKYDLRVLNSTYADTRIKQLAWKKTGKILYTGDGVDAISRKSHNAKVKRNARRR